MIDGRFFIAAVCEVGFLDAVSSKYSSADIQGTFYLCVPEMRSKIVALVPKLYGHNFVHLAPEWMEIYSTIVIKWRGLMGCC